jgi:alkylation response protein AidB-like acyl-CoA dehydrogenase
VDRPVTARTVYDADHEALRDSVRRFLAAEAVPHYADWDAKGAIPDRFWTAAAEHGFLGLADAGDPRFAAVVLEEAMAAGLPAIALALATHESFAPLTGRDSSGLVAFVDGVRAEARDGGWALTGTAETVVNGAGAAVFVVAARTDDDTPVVFVVDAAAVHRSPAPALLGLDALDLADVRFDRVPVTAADQVPGALDAARASHHLALAVAAMAGARTALTITAEYVKQRKAFGRPIAEFENTQRALAAVTARVTATGAFVDNLLADPAARRPDAAAAAAFCAAEVLGSAVDTGVQLHGGYGYMWEYPIARAYAAARFFRLHADPYEHLPKI